MIQRKKPSVYVELPIYWSQNCFFIRTFALTKTFSLTVVSFFLIVSIQYLKTCFKI
jgi:hypothetical protein